MDPIFELSYKEQRETPECFGQEIPPDFDCGDCSLRQRCYQAWDFSNLLNMGFSPDEASECLDNLSFQEWMGVYGKEVIRV